MTAEPPRTSEPQDAAPGEGRDMSGPRSLNRLLHLFDTLARAPDGLSLADLNQALDTPKSSLLNLLRPLVAEGYLMHSRGVYRLGLMAFRMATNLLSAWDLPRAYRAYVEMLGERTGETALLAIANRETGLASYVDIVPSSQPIRFQVPVGTTRVLHTAAVGRVLLAFDDAAATQAYVESARLADGMNRPFKRKALAAQMAAIREAGHETSVDRFIQGLASIAAPIFDTQGKCVAAIAIAGPSDRIAARRKALIAAVTQVARLASEAQASEAGTGDIPG